MGVSDNMWVFSVKQGLESVPQLATAHSPLRGSQMPSEASVAFFLLQVPLSRATPPCPFRYGLPSSENAEESAKLFNFSLDLPEIGCILGADAEVLRLSLERTELWAAVAAGGNYQQRSPITRIIIK